MKVRVLASARQDILEIAQFYNRQQTGLGRRVYDILEHAVEELRWQAGIHPTVDEKHLAKYLSKFPIAIYYRVENDEAQVYAVIDTRRDPEWISDHVQ